MLDLGRAEALLPQAEQVPYERPEAGTRVKAYIVEVRKTAKGPQIVVSRTHPGLIKRLFELEVPEIADGVVEIKACAREPGHRTKIAVWSNDHNVDPVGVCVGARGGRVRMVVTELRGEKIDIVPFSEDQPDFVAKALSPAKVKEVRIHEDTGVAEVIVPDHQLSLAIGKEGQNARLAARLTGWRIDIKSETQISEEEQGIFRNERYAEGRWITNPDTGEQEFHAADGSVIARASGPRIRPRPCPANPTMVRPRQLRPTQLRPKPTQLKPTQLKRRSLSTSPTRRWRRIKVPGPTPDQPLRTCVGCRKVRPQPELVRLAVGADTKLLAGRDIAGRGAWLCVGSLACLNLAIKKRAFERALRVTAGRLDFSAVRQIFEAATPDVAD